MINHLKILIICTISFIFSTDIYVPIDFPTIQDAINYAENFDYIFVNGGNYDECIFIEGKSIFIIGNEMENNFPIINCSLQGTSVITVQNISENPVNISGFILNGIDISNGLNILNSEVELSNIEIENVKPLGLYGINSNIQIENLIIQNPGENTEILMKFFNSNINFNSGVLENFSSNELNSSVFIALNSIVSMGNVLIQNNNTFDDGTFRIFNSDFIGNYLSFINNQLDFGQGGAIYSFHSGVEIKNSYFENNSAPIGGSISSQGSSLKLNNSFFIENSSNTGGAISHTSDSLYIDNCQFKSNISENGGAIYAFSSFVSINKSLCIENYSNLFGGCLLIRNGELIITFSNIIKNESLMRDNISSNSSDIFILNSVFQKEINYYYNFLLFEDSRLFISNSVIEFTELLDMENEMMVLSQNNFDIEDATIPLFIDEDNYFPNPESILIDNASFNFEFNDSTSVEIDSILFWGEAPDIGMMEFIPGEELGDVNSDGVNDIMDIILLSLIIQNNIIMIEIQFDISQDGEVTILDLILLIQIIISG